MANTRENGIIKSVALGNFTDKNGNTQYELMVELSTGIQHKMVVYSKNAQQYPHPVGTKIFFDVDLNFKQNNQYKGEHYKIMGVKNEQKELENVQYDNNQNNNQGQQLPPPLPINNQEEVMKALSLSIAIEFYANVLALSESKPELKSVGRTTIFQLADKIHNNYFIPNKTTPIIYLKAAITQAKDMYELNPYLTAPIENSDVLISTAAEILLYYIPGNVSNTNTVI